MFRLKSENALQNQKNMNIKIQVENSLFSNNIDAYFSDDLKEMKIYGDVDIHITFPNPPNNPKTVEDYLQFIKTQHPEIFL